MVKTGKNRAFDRVEEIYQDGPARVRELKAEGRKIVGYYCCYPPLEILTAVDLVPYRIFGDMAEPITEADRVLPTSFCPFMRSCLDLVCKGKYDFLDGVVGCHSCDAQEKTTHTWKSVIRYPWFPYIDIPHTTHEWSLRAFKAILSDFKKAAESFAGKEASPARLKAAIELYNQQRVLVWELYELRKQAPPLISGTETLQVMVALARIPVEEGNELLREVIDEVKQRKERPQKKSARILVWGGSIDSVSLTRVIEEHANLVMDDNCVGSRNYLSEVELTDDPLDGLSHRYLTKIMCPRTFRETMVGEIKKDHKADLESRFGYLRNYIEQWKVNGVLLLLVRFCDPHAFEVPELMDYLDIIGVPRIYLEHDYTEGALSALRTRVQAFVEIID